MKTASKQSEINAFSTLKKRKNKSKKESAGQGKHSSSYTTDSQGIKITFTEKKKK